jgi:hypothetical protein
LLSLTEATSKTILPPAAICHAGASVAVVWDLSGVIDVLLNAATATNNLFGRRLLMISSYATSRRTLGNPTLPPRKFIICHGLSSVDVALRDAFQVKKVASGRLVEMRGRAFGAKTAWLIPGLLPLNCQSGPC